MAGVIDASGTWSIRGIEGMERMRLLRDDIKSRVGKLYAELTAEWVAVALRPGVGAGDA